MAKDDRPTCFVRLESLDGRAGSAALRALAVKALTKPVGVETVDGHGVHDVNHLPHDVASELINRLDDGRDFDELAAWLVEQLPGRT